MSFRGGEENAEWLSVAPEDWPCDTCAHPRSAHPLDPPLGAHTALRLPPARAPYGLCTVHPFPHLERAGCASWMVLAHE